VCFRLGINQIYSVTPLLSSLSCTNALNNYHVDQLWRTWPSPNECVTAATIAEINMMQDILTDKFGIPSIQHWDLNSFTTMFDNQSPRNWFTRPPANVPIVGGMLPGLS